jgi:hypothetical protein
MKLWVKDAPVMGLNKDEEVLDFVAKHITCSLPDALESPELRRMVEQYQKHNCTKSCTKYAPSSPNPK